MLDTCTVESIGAPVTDDDGNVTSPRTTVYEGRCKIATYEPHERNPDVAGATYTLQRYSVHVPVGSFKPAVGHVVTITAAALDPHLAGHEFRVEALLHKTAATAYRLGVEAVV